VSSSLGEQNLRPQCVCARNEMGIFSLTIKSLSQLQRS
jgi:hypothetical protein